VFDRLVTDQSPTVNKNRIQARDGREVLVEWHGRPVLRPDGKLDYFFGVGLDITERERAAAEKARLEAQLAQSQKMEAVGRLAGGVAHDFNNMLAAIQGYAELLLRSLAPEDPLRSHAEQIFKASQRSAGLTQQLLAFSRRQVIVPRVVDVNRLIEDSTRMLGRLIGEDVALTVVPDADIGRVMADPNQLDHVLVNLVVNARDAMPDGGRLTIETAEEEVDDVRGQAWGVPAGRYVVISVSDTGCGMDEEMKAKIFEPFFTTKEKGVGTGLGLATVHGIIKQNGGHISVISEPGVGTTFMICLPRVDAPAEETREIPAPVVPTGTETILLVEDEEMVRRLAQAILERLGYHVLEVDQAGDAHRLCESHPEPIHLLLTDVVMPDLNGRELFERVRGLRPDMKVLFMSGYTQDVIAQHGVLEQGIDLIEKPFSVQGLARKIRDVLDKPASGGAGAR
jgi:signal transduction histidine kinase/ActR/RegA family two-component response regulator